MSSSSGGQQVRAAGRDELDGLGEPALVAFRGLVPGAAVGGVHAADVGPLGGRRGADVGIRVVVGGHVERVYGASAGTQVVDTATTCRV